MLQPFTFVCYAREDLDFVRGVAEQMTVRHVPVWTDLAIPPGADWDRTIDLQLRSCARVLIVLSPDAVRSSEVRGELRLALNLSKPIVPVLYRPCEIPRQLQSVQYLDFTANRDGAAYAALAKALLSNGDGAPAMERLDSRALRNRHDLLDDVRTEVAGRLAQSHLVHELDLPKQTRPDLVAHAWDAAVKFSNAQPERVSSDMPIAEIFDDAIIAGKLLILGAPGSGKTITMLELSQTLIHRAEIDVAQPVPILCSLASWRGGQPLAAWLVGQLKTKYGVRTDNGQEWLGERLLAPFLDGLDEVAPEYQELCVQAINEFQQEYRPRHFVVCGRRAEYENNAARLQMNGAIELLPLADDHIRRYLSRAGREDLWQQISGDPQWLDLARSPLLLGIMTIAHEETPAGDWQRSRSDAGRQSQLFDVYIRRLFSRQLESASTEKRETIQWLAWLAQTMKRQSQAEFSIEHLQPTSLNAGQKWLYRVGVFACGSVLFFLAMALSNALFELIPRGPVPFSAVAFRWLPASISASQANVVLLVIMSAATGVVLATTRQIRPVETIIWSASKAWSELTRELRRMTQGGLNYFAYAGVHAGLLAGVVIVLGVPANVSNFRRWDIAGRIAGAIVILVLAIGIGGRVRPRTWLIRKPRRRWASPAAAALLTGLLFALATLPGVGPAWGGLYGTSLALIGVSCGWGIPLLGVAKVVTSGLVIGSGVAVMSWLLLPVTDFASWIGGWLVGAAGLGASVTVVAGSVATFANKRSVDDPTAAGATWDVGTRKWLAFTALGLAVAGVIIALAVFAGGLPLVKGMQVLTAMLAFTLASALCMSMALGLTIGAVGAGLAATAGALSGVFKGVTGPDVERRTMPNQGIRQSARNVGLFVLVGTTIAGVPYGILNTIAGSFMIGSAPGVWDWLHLGLGGAVACGILGAFFPGAACIQHFTLRLVLKCYGFAPLRYARFLNHATERMFLQRVGGRYRFIHDLLRDHVAAMQP